VSKIHGRIEASLNSRAALEPG